MEFQNRRVLLFIDNDVPISAPPPPPPPPSATAMYGSSSLQIPPRPIFTSNIAYAFIILLATLFFLAFILLFLRQFSSFSSSSSATGSRCSEPTKKKSALVTVPYSSSGNRKKHLQEQEEECAICLEELREGETVKMIPHCKHVFHPNCIDTWLLTHVTCPVCRCSKVCEEEEDEEEKEGKTRIRREVVEIRLQESETERAMSSDERREAIQILGGIRRSLGF
ncbi:hypothetical protein PIB30_023082 [Stylosanthes scabra]|uniref:RING-type E3 ubiquitin transferase n=1 Tax=Stylosanthes scabra TaxID=79078 RepID=A0ABU6YB57_9FABA|nr:hypothetical protein [Stylosanthes scabra]